LFTKSLKGSHIDTFATSSIQILATKEVTTSCFKKSLHIMEEMSLYPWSRSIFNQIEFSESTSSAFGFPFVNSGPDMTHNLNHKKYNIRHE